MRGILLLFLLASPGLCFFTELFKGTITRLFSGLGGNQGRLESNEFQKTLTDSVEGLKRDGIALAFNVIHYNYVLNLQKACLVHLELHVCEVFFAHAKDVVNTLIKDQKEELDIKENLITIDQFHKVLFTKPENISTEKDKEIKIALILMEREILEKPEKFDHEALLRSYQKNFERLAIYFEAGDNSSERRMRSNVSEMDGFLDWDN